MIFYFHINIFIQYQDFHYYDYRTKEKKLVIATGEIKKEFIRNNVTQEEILKHR